MLHKLVRLNNIGRFHHCECSHLDIGDFNLVFAENGAGKTTLAGILRSIGRDESGYISERATVGARADPRVKLLTRTNGALQFESGSWGRSTSKVSVDVFDSHFVNENIYSGHTLSHDHKKRLHRFVIGERGRDLSERISRIDTLSRKLQQHIGAIEDRINDTKIDNISIDDFLSLPEVDDVDEKVRQTERRLNAQKKASELREQDDLDVPSLPKIPMDEIQDLLSRSLDDVADDAESVVTDHISDCMDDKGESWVQQGLEYAQSEECPFCGRNISGIDLVKAYKDYFNAEYKALKADVEYKQQSLSTSILPDNGWRQVISILDSNKNRFSLWSDYIDCEHAVPETFGDDLEMAWKQLRVSLANLLNRKKAAPLEPVEIDDQALEAWRIYQATYEKLQAYSEVVIDVNKGIADFKETLESGSSTEIKESLNRLYNLRSRHNELGSNLAQRLKLNRKRKQRIVDEKERVKEDLDDYQSDVLDSCQTRINSFLRNAGATFQIREAGVGYRGGTANAHFSLEINERQIGIGNAVTEVGRQSFRNLLSEGDKTTLAFGFFYARMQESNDLSDHVIVIDDPISSLDEHRRNATRDAILNLADRAGQIFVFSHNPHFLSSLLDKRKAQNADSELFCIQKTGDKTSELRGWEEDELNRKVQSRYYHRFNKLVAYASNRDGDPEEVAHCIRHVLEGNLRRRFPDRYKKSNGSVGAFIGMVGDADEDNPLSDLQGTPYLKELKAIADSDYCHDPHHDNAPFMPLVINETELATWAKRTIRFARGLPTKN
jgi:wobble nucleotide-excising tRNase